MGAAFVQARSESEPDNYLHRKFGTLRAKSHTVDETVLSIIRKPNNNQKHGVDQVNQLQRR